MKRKAKIVGLVLLALFLIYVFMKKDRLSDNAIATDNLADFDLIVSKGQSFQSKLVSIFNFSLMGYTHIGIIHREKNNVYVLHSTPDGTKDNSIRYDRLNIFLDLSSVSDVSILRLRNISDADKNALENEFNKYKVLKVPFDYDFNNSDSKKIYCSELVYLLYKNSNLFSDNQFDISKPIQPREFIKLSSFYEVDCKKTCP